MHHWYQIKEAGIPFYKSFHHPGCRARLCGSGQIISVVQDHAGRAICLFHHRLAATLPHLRLSSQWTCPTFSKLIIFVLKVHSLNCLVFIFSNQCQEGQTWCDFSSLRCHHWQNLAIYGNPILVGIDLNLWSLSTLSFISHSLRKPKSESWCPKQHYIPKKWQ